MSKSGNSKTTAVALTKNSDVPSVLQAIEAKIQSIEKITTTPWQATTKCESFGNRNLRDETKLENLARALSALRGKKREYDAAFTDSRENLGMGKTNYPAFVDDGCTIEQWHHDIVLRMNIIEQEETLNKLNKHKAAMTKFLSEEDQKAAVINDFMNDFINK